MWKNIWSKVFLQGTHVQLQTLNLCRTLGSVYCLIINIWCNLSSDISPLQVGLIFQAVHCGVYHFVCGWVRDIALQHGFHVPGCQTMYKWESGVYWSSYRDRSNYFKWRIQNYGKTISLKVGDLISCPSYLLGLGYCTSYLT